jgi:hypothetical protein
MEPGDSLRRLQGPADNHYRERDDSNPYSSATKSPVLSVIAYANAKNQPEPEAVYLQDISLPKPVNLDYFLWMTTCTFHDEFSPFRCMAPFGLPAIFNATYIVVLQDGWQAKSRLPMKCNGFCCDNQMAVHENTPRTWIQSRLLRL